jgi:hypothetical protein
LDEYVSGYAELVVEAADLVERPRTLAVENLVHAGALANDADQGASVFASLFELNLMASMGPGRSMG